MFTNAFGSGSAHLSQLRPGTKVQDNLRCRKTELEIAGEPRETAAGMLFGELPTTGKPVASSWLVDVWDPRAKRLDTTRVDCDADGRTDRFHVLL